MSCTRKPEDAPSARQVRDLLQGVSARFTGKKRGNDPAVRRNSYDVDHPEANQWSKIEDGSVGAGLAHREALLETAEELYHQQWREMPAVEIRAARKQRATIAAELQEHVGRGEAPMGHPAALRQQLAALDELLERATLRLRRVDLTVLRALIKRLDFATGKLFPSIETIAADAGCHRNSVVAALRRLKSHGFFDWVRRSIKTGNDGEFAPQRAQTSNGYRFDHRRMMAPRTWQRFWQRFVIRLRRLGKVPATLQRQAAPEPASPDVDSLREAIHRLGLTVKNAST